MVIGDAFYAFFYKCIADFHLILFDFFMFDLVNVSLSGALLLDINEKCEQQFIYA
jgi:hypothetical protein